MKVYSSWRINKDINWLRTSFYKLSGAFQKYSYSVHFHKSKDALKDNVIKQVFPASSSFFFFFKSRDFHQAGALEEPWWTELVVH